MTVPSSSSAERRALPLELLRGNRPFWRIGHRGAAALAPENTLRALAAAVELGCDALEVDVLDLDDGTLLLAHSGDLLEVSHGAAAGRVRRQSLESLRQVAPELPTLDEALAFATERFPEVVLQLDLKLRMRAVDAAVEALRRHDVADRTFVSAFDAPLLRRFAELAPELPRSRTFPRDRYGVGRRRMLRPLRRPGAAALRRAVAWRIPQLLREVDAVAVTLHHSGTSRAAIECAHGLGAAVFVWTVDDPALARRLVELGADGIITNDPRIFREVTTS
jgi:glycerophosphoryl diester phosphodiesterase